MGAELGFNLCTLTPGAGPPQTTWPQCKYRQADSQRPGPLAQMLGAVAGRQQHQVRKKGKDLLLDTEVSVYNIWKCVGYQRTHNRK